MTREQAIELARIHAKAQPQSYYSEPFQPHEWVIAAIMAAAPAEQKPFSLPGVRLPVDVMAGADWNILDSRGVRVAIAGSLEGDKWETNPALARALVDMINCAAIAIKK